MVKQDVPQQPATEQARERREREQAMPHWMREVLRLAQFKTQIYLHGGIADTVLYPADAECMKWRLGALREALFELLGARLPGYEVVASYSFIDGLHFADELGENKMAERLNELIKQAGAGRAQAAQRALNPQAPTDPIDHALHQLRMLMLNREHPVLIVVEHASQLITAPVNMPLAERMSFLRLLRASLESQAVAVGDGAGRRTLHNMLILLCDKLTDLPAWLYLANPYSGSVEIGLPRMAERRLFFEQFLPEEARELDLAKLADLTDGLRVQELCAIRRLIRRPAAAGDGARRNDAKAIIDRYKYGDRESEWDSLEHGRLVNAEETLAHRVLGQPAAVAAVADVLRRARLNLSGAQHSSRSKPRGVLFFAGPTGVGKTEMAKAVAELVFHTEEALVRFDMSEYSQPHADQRLLGAPPGYVGYEEGGQLTDRMLANPFSVLLFDEIEKAHPSILDKFLQILEDGRLTDGRGQTVFFSEAIVVFTSNVGIYQIDPMTGRPRIDPATNQPLLHVDPAFDKEYPQVRLKVLSGVEDYFKHYLGRPELLNRIGQNIIVFDYVREPQMRLILDRKVLPSIQHQVRAELGVEVAFAPLVSDQLMALAGRDVSAGGRGVGNLAESAILNPLARIIFNLLGEGGELSGKTLHVQGVVLPEASAGHRYELEYDVA
jgi:ATP-dependent Clp protease ATP-binding subunit ClpA